VDELTPDALFGGADFRNRSNYKDRTLQVTAYGTYPVPDPAEDEKTIDARLDRIIEKNARLTPVRKILVAT